MQYFCCPVINISDIFSESFRTFHQLAKRQYFNELLYSGTGHPASII